MKKVLAILLMCFSTAVLAQHHGHGIRHHGFKHHHHNHGWWIGPAIVGGVVTYALTRPAPAPQPTVIYTMPPPPPAGYYWENIHDADCNCYRTVLVPYQQPR